MGPPFVEAPYARIALAIILNIHTRTYIHTYIHTHAPFARTYMRTCALDPLYSGSPLYSRTAVPPL